MADAASIEAPTGWSSLPFPVVAIGASAGGVEALRRLFGVMPADIGCAFIVTMHIDPDRESMLAALLGHVTTMPVLQAEHDAPVAINHVYTAPPGQYVRMEQGRLVLSPIPRGRPRELAADHLMISLARDQHERAIAIVMTGTDGDGALGVKAIKGEGGLTIAQTPASAAHPGMPSSALATGMVDRQLQIEEMPEVLRRYAAAFGTAAPDAGPRSSETLLLDVLGQVRIASSLDFRGYKRPMLVRRIRRRMGMTGITSIAAYLQRLESNPKEAAALASDLLIGVTDFFREPEAWQALAQEIVPKLLAEKQDGESLRAWVPGCATGQEAYSLAMVLLEDPRLSQMGLRLQIFATDIDQAAITAARKGTYDRSVSHSVRPERLRRFFDQTEDGYRVRKELREVVLFAAQNVITDPPFSHMDLVSCRNLLIYMGPELQRRVLQTFHFALDPGRFLFLGKSESVGSLSTHFATVSHSARIYCRLGAVRLPPPQRSSQWPAQRGLPPLASPRDPSPDYRRLVREALLEHRLVDAALVDPEGRILYYYGGIHSWFGRLEGEPTDDVFSMLAQELREPLRNVMNEAAASGRRAELTIPPGEPDRFGQPVRLSALPLTGSGSLLLVIDLERLERAPDPAHSSREPGPQMLRSLEDELHHTKQELRAVIEELEATNEELKVANEEAMSVNEELQSSNEELETSKEELQSINEELASINTELQEKVAQLELANDDLANLLSSTHIPTLFLDRELRIKRFTPAATRLFSLIPGDLGRPLADIASRSDMRSLLEDAAKVLAELSPAQREIGTDDGEHFLRRTLPYRTHDDRINGVVVTFTDITEFRRATEGRQQLATVVHSSTDAIIVHDLAGKVLAWNRGAETMYGYQEDEVLGKPLDALLPEDARAPYRVQVEAVLAGRPMQGFETRRCTRQGAIVDVSVSISAVLGSDGRPSAVALIERDITQRKRAEAELRASEERFRALADSAPVLIWTTDAQGCIDFANRECALATGRPAASLRGRRWTELLHPDDISRAQALPGAAGYGMPATPRVEFMARLVVDDGSTRWTKTVVMPRGDLLQGHVGCTIDIQSQIEAEESLRKADQRKDEFLAMLGHELRNPLAPIRNAAEVLARTSGDDPRLVWVRDTLVRQVEHVTRLVDDLLDISRVARGAMELRMEPVDLCGAVERAVDAARAMLERKRHRYAVRMPDEPIWVQGDAMRLVQIFENLLTNAAKYTDEGGDVSVELAVENAQAVAHVRDNGMGIAPGMQARMFELFVQDERSIDRSQGGLGIGLSLARHLVLLHGGEIEAHSAGTGQGSDFVVRLPMLHGHVPSPAEQAHGRGDGAGGRVMIVDDDLEATASLAMVLELGGFEVAQANDLDSALQQAARLVPDVVVMDLAMPQADGYEVVRRLRALPALTGTRYVALSGFGRAEDRLRTLSAGFAHHFAKPVDPARLEQVLRDLLTRSGNGNDTGGSREPA